MKDNDKIKFPIAPVHCNFALNYQKFIANVFFWGGNSRIADQLRACLMQTIFMLYCIVIFLAAMLRCMPCHDIS